MSGYTGIDGATITEDQVRDAVMRGIAFSVFLEQVTTGAANTYVGIQLLANNIAKNILAVRAVATQGQAFGVNRLYQEIGTATADTSLTVDLVATGVVQNAGGVAVASALTSILGSPSGTTKVGTFSGKQVAIGSGAANAMIEMLTQGHALFIPKGTLGSISHFSKVVTSGNAASVFLFWIEF